MSLVESAKKCLHVTEYILLAFCRFPITLKNYFLIFFYNFIKFLIKMVCCEIFRMSNTLTSLLLWPHSLNVTWAYICTYIYIYSGTGDYFAWRILEFYDRLAWIHWNTFFEMYNCGTTTKPAIKSCLANFICCGTFRFKILE